MDGIDILLFTGFKNHQTPSNICPVKPHDRPGKALPVS